MSDKKNEFLYIKIFVKIIKKSTYFKKWIKINTDLVFIHQLPLISYSSVSISKILSL